MGLLQSVCSIIFCLLSYFLSIKFYRIFNVAFSYAMRKVCFHDYCCSDLFSEIYSALHLTKVCACKFTNFTNGSTFFQWLVYSWIFFKDQKVVTFDDMTEQCIWFHDIHNKYYFVFKPNSIRPSLIFVYKSVISAWRGDKVSLANCWLLSLCIHFLNTENYLLTIRRMVTNLKLNNTNLLSERRLM